MIFIVFVAVHMFILGFVMVNEILIDANVLVVVNFVVAVVDIVIVVVVNVVVGVDIVVLTLFGVTDHIIFSYGQI